MFTREEHKQLRTTCWTAFGRIMRPHPSATGRKVRWTNYRTGIKHVYVRLDLDKSEACFSIDLQHPDPGIRELFWEQFLEFRTYLHGQLGAEMIWDQVHTTPEGPVVSRIWDQLPEVSLYKQETWPDAFAFLKERLLGWDQFWADVQDVFLALER